MAPKGKTDGAFVLGASMLSAIAGAIVGLGLGVLLLAAGWGHSISRPVLGGAAAGALVGVLMPEAALDFVETVVHFVFGFLLGPAGLESSGQDEVEALQSRWLRLAFLFGGAFAFALWMLSDW